MRAPPGCPSRSTLALAFAASTLLAATHTAHAAQVCGGPELEPGDHLDLTLTVGSEIRSYDVHVPASYDGSLPVPLVLDFHPMPATKEIQASSSGFKEKSDEEGFVVVHPQSLAVPGGWNGGFCCGGADDVGFARAIVDALDQVVNIDHSRVYASGLSSGGLMSHWLACEAADVFAAVAPVSAPLFSSAAFPRRSTCDVFNPDAPSRPISVQHFHGLDDLVIPYGGGPGISFPAEYPAAQDSFAYWGQVNGCVGPPTITFDDGERSTCEAFTNCQDGVQVELCSLDSVGLIDGHRLYPNTVLDIPDWAWDFLRQARLPLPDGDLDGIADRDDNCAATANADQADPDGDCVGSACDNCPGFPNPDQEPIDPMLCPEPGRLLIAATAFATLGALHRRRRRMNA